MLRTLCRRIFYVGLPMVFLLQTEALTAAAAYGQLSSLVSQVPASAGTNYVKMDQTDEILNLALSPKKDQIIIKEDGVYLIIASGQVGAISSEASGYMDIWFVKNGKPVPNSGCRMTISDATQTAVLISQISLTLKAGDAIAAGYSTNTASLGFIFIQPDNEPAIPSYLCSIIKISESAPSAAPTVSKPSAKK